MDFHTPYSVNLTCVTLNYWPTTVNNFKTLLTVILTLISSHLTNTISQRLSRGHLEKNYENLFYLFSFVFYFLVSVWSSSYVIKLYIVK